MYPFSTFTFQRRGIRTYQVRVCVYMRSYCCIDVLRTYLQRAAVSPSHSSISSIWRNSTESRLLVAASADAVAVAVLLGHETTRGWVAYFHTTAAAVVPVVCVSIPSTAAAV